jgi:hypothetical protein
MANGSKEHKASGDPEPPMRADDATKAGMSRKTKEMPVCDRSIKVLRSAGQTRLRPVRDLRWGRTTHPNKPNRFKSWCVNQIDGFPPKTKPTIYLTCCQWDTTKFGPVFEKNGCLRLIKDWGPPPPRPAPAGNGRFEI